VVKLLLLFFQFCGFENLAKLFHFFGIFSGKVRQKEKGNFQLLLSPWFDFGGGGGPQNFAKFRPEKYDFNLYKGFLMRSIAQIRQILKEKKFQIIRFL
jgi:hypothetical protein